MHSAILGKNGFNLACANTWQFYKYLTCRNYNVVFSLQTEHFRMVHVIAFSFHEKRLRIQNVIRILYASLLMRIMIEFDMFCAIIASISISIDTNNLTMMFFSQLALIS